MALKTRKEILEKDHDSATEQFIENEINIISLERRAEKLSPGKEYDEIMEKVKTRKTSNEQIQSVIVIIDELIAKEAK